MSLLMEALQKAEEENALNEKSKTGKESNPSSSEGYLAPPTPEKENLLSNKKITFELDEKPYIQLENKTQIQEEMLTHNDILDDVEPKDLHTNEIIDGSEKTVTNDPIDNDKKSHIESIPQHTHDENSENTHIDEDITRAVFAAKTAQQKHKLKQKWLLALLLVVSLIVLGVFAAPMIKSDSSFSYASSLLSVDKSDEYEEYEYEEERDEFLNAENTEDGLDSLANTFPNNEEKLELENFSTTSINTNLPTKLDFTSLSKNESLPSKIAQIAKALPTEISSNSITDENLNNSAVSKPPAIKMDDTSNGIIFSLSRETKSSLDTLLKSAFNAYKEGELSAASDKYKQILSTNNSHRGALLGLSAIASKEGDHNQALSFYTKLLQQNPNDPFAKAGLVNLTENNSTIQTSTLKSLIHENPTLPHLEFALGNIYAAQGHWAEAQSAYFNALSKEKKSVLTKMEINPDYAYNLAISLEHLNKPDLAIEYYREAITYAYKMQSSFEISLVEKRLQTLSK